MVNSTRNQHGFKKGNKIATGGKRPGAGRKTEDFKKALGDAIEEHDILGRVVMMATGQLEVSDKVQLSAALWLLEMKHGKPSQAFEHSGSLTLESLIGGTAE